MESEVSEFVKSGSFTFYSQPRVFRLLNTKLQIRYRRAFKRYLDVLELRLRELGIGLDERHRGVIFSQSLIMVKVIYKEDLKKRVSLRHLIAVVSYSVLQRDAQAECLDVEILYRMLSSEETFRRRQLGFYRRLYRRVCEGVEVLRCRGVEALRGEGLGGGGLIKESRLDFFDKVDRLAIQICSFALKSSGADASLHHRDILAKLLWFSPEFGLRLRLSKVKNVSMAISYISLKIHRNLELPYSSFVKKVAHEARCSPLHLPSEVFLGIVSSTVGIWVINEMFESFFEFLEKKAIASKPFMKLMKAKDPVLLFDTVKILRLKDRPKEQRQHLGFVFAIVMKVRELYGRFVEAKIDRESKTPISIPFDHDKSFN